jgi:hypothetical protein
VAVHVQPENQGMARHPLVETAFNAAVRWTPTLREGIRNLWDPYPFCPYTRRLNCLFIHVPRTGGTSVLRALGVRRRRFHAPFWVFEQADARRFAQYFKFAFVRNPWDRAVSTYFYLRNGGAGGADDVMSDLLRSRYDSFDKFVLDYLDEERIYTVRLLRPQNLYLYDHWDQCRMDFVGRFENLAADFAIVAQKLGLRPSVLPRVNTSEHAPYREHCANDAVREKLRRLYRRDIELFGYTF